MTRRRHHKSRDHRSRPPGRVMLDVHTMLWLCGRFSRVALGEARRTVRAWRLQ